MSDNLISVGESYITELGIDLDKFRLKLQDKCKHLRDTAKNLKNNKIGNYLQLEPAFFLDPIIEEMLANIDSNQTVVDKKILRLSLLYIGVKNERGKPDIEIKPYLSEGNIRVYSEYYAHTFKSLLLEMKLANNREDKKNTNKSNVFYFTVLGGFYKSLCCNEGKYNPANNNYFDISNKANHLKVNNEEKINKILNLIEQSKSKIDAAIHTMANQRNVQDDYLNPDKIVNAWKNFSADIIANEKMGDKKITGHDFRIIKRIDLEPLKISNKTKQRAKNIKNSLPALIKLIAKVDYIAKNNPRRSVTIKRRKDQKFIFDEYNKLHIQFVEKLNTFFDDWSSHSCTKNNHLREA